MPRKKKKLKPSTVLKDYWRDNGQFADLFNAVLFDGEQVIRPEDLEDGDTDESTVMEHRGEAEAIAGFRDNIKVQKVSHAHKVQLVLLGLEHQEHVHYAMPMRVMGYDYGSYKKQYDKNARNYKSPAGMDGDEYLSRMKRGDRFWPVITIMVYYGERPWDGPLSLHGMLDIPEGMEKYVNDYKMLLVEARENNLKLHNMNNVDLFNMLEILMDRERPLTETREKAISYAIEHKVGRPVVMAVAGAARCRVDYGLIGEEGEGGMWAVFEETRKEGIIEGEQKGKMEMVLAMLREGYTYQQIMKVSSLTEEKVREIEEKGKQA